MCIKKENKMIPASLSSVRSKCSPTVFDPRTTSTQPIAVQKGISNLEYFYDVIKKLASKKYKTLHKMIIMEKGIFRWSALHVATAMCDKELALYIYNNAGDEKNDLLSLKADGAPLPKDVAAFLK